MTAVDFFDAASAKFAMNNNDLAEIWRNASDGGATATQQQRPQIHPTSNHPLLLSDLTSKTNTTNSNSHFYSCWSPVELTPTAASSGGGSNEENQQPSSMDFTNWSNVYNWINSAQQQQPQQQQPQQHEQASGSLGSNERAESIHSGDSLFSPNKRIESPCAVAITAAVQRPAVATNNPWSLLDYERRDGHYQQPHHQRQCNTFDDFFSQPTTPATNTNYDQSLLEDLLKLNLLDSSDPHPILGGNHSNGGCGIDALAYFNRINNNGQFKQQPQPQQQKMSTASNSLPMIHQQHTEVAKRSFSSGNDLYLQQQHQQPQANEWNAPTFRSNCAWSTSTEVEVDQVPKFRPIVGGQCKAPGHGLLKTTPIQAPQLQQYNTHFALPQAPLTHNSNNNDNVCCDEAELKWYHKHLEMQQSIYEHFYGLILNNQLPPPQQHPKQMPLQRQMSQQNAPTAPMNSPIDSPPTTPCTATAQPHRSPAAMELQVRLEECTEQYKQLEKERKKTEAELARHNLGKKISSANQLPIPRLPPAPSRVDRLVVDFFREHARVVTLLGKMEQLRQRPLDNEIHSIMRALLDSIRLLQQCRLNERTSILNQLRGDVGRYNEEKETASLLNALVTLNGAVLRARSANWYSLSLTINREGVDDGERQAKMVEIVAANFEMEPPEIHLNPII